MVLKNSKITIPQDKTVKKPDVSRIDPRTIEIAKEKPDLAFFFELFKELGVNQKRRMMKSSTEKWIGKWFNY